jgi:hypothetical protein
MLNFSVLKGDDLGLKVIIELAKVQCTKKNIINGFLQEPIAISDLIDEVKNQIGQKNKES